MERITADNLNNVVARINRLMGANVEATRNVISPTEKYVWNVGTYIIDWKSRSRVALEVITDASGTTHRVIDGCTKRELYNQMHAMIAGIEAMQKRNDEKLCEFVGNMTNTLALDASPALLDKWNKEFGALKNAIGS
jgi:hypothetical protein